MTSKRIVVLPMKDQMSRLLLVLAVLLAVPATADAATYTVWSCKKPNGTPAPAEGWSIAGGNIAGNACAGGGPLRAGWNSAPGQNPFAESILTFTAPAGSKIASYLIYRSVSIDPGLAPGYEYYHHIDGEHVESCGTPCTAGSGAAPLSEGNARTAANRSASAMTFRIRCVSTDPAVACPGSADGLAAHVDVHRAAIQLTDDALPEFVGQPSGTLLDGTRSHSGTISASFQAKDTGGGVYEALVEVDGQVAARQVVDANEGRCAQPFTSLKPCKASASGTVSLDTTKIANGRHDVRLVVTDATGENTVAVGPVAITVDNSGGRGAPNGNGASEQAKLTAGFRGRRGTSLTTRINRKVVVEGRLTDAAGRAITGATIDIAGIERRAGAPEGPVATAVTAADGRWSATVTASVGRRLIARYRAFLNDSRAAAVAELALKVRASVTFTSSATSIRPPKRVTFSGRLRGASAGRKIVVLQVFQGGRWRGFEDLRTDRRGVFRFTYNFRIRKALRLKWRVQIPKEASYPYETVNSRARPLRIRG